MPMRANERVAWFNGEFMPESEVRIPFRDFELGLRRRRLRHDPQLRPSPVQGEGACRPALSLAQVSAHRSGLRAGEDVRADARSCSSAIATCSGPTTTTGSASASAAASRRPRATISTTTGPTSCSNARPCRSCSAPSCSRRASAWSIPSHRRVPPDSLTPRAKTHNYLNLIVANQEVQSIDPEAWALLLDVNGNLCEGMGSNVFVGARRRASHPAREIRPAGREPADRDRSRPAGRSAGARGRHRPLRCLQCRRGFPHLDVAVHLPGDARERHGDRPQGTGVGASDQAPRRRLPALRRSHDFVGQYLKRYVEGMEARAF